MAARKLRVVQEPVTAADQAEALLNLPTEYLMCRRGSGLGHLWKLVGVWSKSGTTPKIGMVMHRLTRCERCRTELEVEFRLGIPNSQSYRRYVYPDGYLLPRGHTIQFSDVQLALMARLEIGTERPGGDE